MARPRKDQQVDLSVPQDLTAGLIDRMACPAGKQQGFLRDSRAPGLRVRATAAGAKSFVFEAKLNRQTIRRTIGDVRTWSIEQARTESRRIAVMFDGGYDPRIVERDAQKAVADERAMAEAHSVQVSVVWGHHPLRETLINQTGASVTVRRAFLADVYQKVQLNPSQEWDPPDEND